ncbi:MAG: hypothetical protein JEZ09_07040 [Salinivirgaceae bacterium]|nr:hypothetical protein [Salinivirgaceae bacterium]
MTQIKSELLLTYKGNLSFDTIDEILSQYKKVIKPLPVDLVIKKRLYSILVECLENTYRHNSKIKPTLTHNLVELSLIEGDNTFNIIVGNYIKKAKLNNLKSKIEFVNTLDQNGLNKLYKKSISKARISDKGGAGLGIIEIARNSRQKINYKIGKTEEDCIFFNFEIKISKYLNKTI